MEILARAVGRRKEAVAQVQLVRGNGQFFINDKPAQVYLQNNSCSLICIKAPVQAALSLSSQNEESLPTNEIPSFLPSSGEVTPLVPPLVGEKGEGLRGFSPKGEIQKIEKMPNSVEQNPKELITTSPPIEQSESQNLSNVPPNGVLPNLSKDSINMAIKENKSSFISSASSFSEPSLTSFHTPNPPLGFASLTPPLEGLNGTQAKGEGELYALHEIDVIIKVKGGGLIGQAEAIQLGVARAFCIMENSYEGYPTPSGGSEARRGLGAVLRKILKTKGYLTQDSRVKERRKYGLKKARKASQYHKR